MIHEVFPVGRLQCNCSVIADEATREAMVIDPGDDIEDVMAVLTKHNLTVQQIVITHAHIDHVGGATKLKRLTGSPVLLNENDHALLKMLPVQAVWIGMASPEAVTIDQNIKSGDLVQAGAIKGIILHTPGHTEGSTCIHLAEHNLLLAGDTLFAGSSGRTDLPGGDFKQIMRSLPGTVLALPDSTIVIPGHGPATTIGEERATNPFLQK